MKRIFFLISAAVLSVIAGAQTALAQKVTLYMADNQTYEYDISQVDSIVFSDGQTIPSDEIIVTVDANGNADGGHRFTKISDACFYIDDIQYTAQSGDLVVTGYDRAFFKGTANIISVLKYNGRTMNVVSIKGKAFQGCTSLTSVTIPNSVTSIGIQAFQRCGSLTSVFIGNGVTSIGANAFSECSSLTSITIGNSLTSIGGSAFSGCTSLTSVTIPNSVTSIGGSAFSGCTSLTSVTIPNSVTSIGDGAFNRCTALISVAIPESVTSIGEDAFRLCSGLTSIIVDSGNTVYDSRSNCNAIIETATNTLIAGCKNTTIPESVSSIAGSAFYGCSSLTSVTIPGSVTSIGELAFWNCSSLTSITIPNSVTSIGESAFEYCTSLSSVTIGSGVTSIGEDAFFLCLRLTDVYCYAENVPNAKFKDINGNVFYAFALLAIDSATLHVPAGSVDAYKAVSPWKNFGSIVAIE